VSPVEVTRASLDYAAQQKSRYNAFIAIWRDTALQAAQGAKRLIGQGTYLGPLHGVPMALKDIFARRGCRVTNGSKIYAQ
jgi:Asp-tRNA(Asn)/Glu-tRNA(Gln) amidotransferase A subunit family amidase